MQKNFHFVQVQTSEKCYGLEYKKEVHVEAMRAFRRQQRAQRTSHYQKRIAAELPSASDDAQSPATDSLSVLSTRSNTPQQTILPLINQSAYLATEALDPFTTLSLELGVDHQILLSHFQTTISSILLPGTAHGSKDSWGSRWLEASIENPTLLLATCAHSSAHLDMVSHGKSSPRTLKLQAAALRALNQSLDKCISDSTLGAVALIAGNALLPADPEEFEHLHIHVTALLKMISLRGGMDRIGRGRFREALQLGINLLFGPYEILSPRSHNLDAITAILPDMTNKMWTTRDLIAECRHLTDVHTKLESATDVDIGLVQYFSDRRSALEVYLGRYLQGNATSHDSGVHQTSIDRTVRLAAVLYAIYILRNFSSGGILTAKPTQELIETVPLLLDSNIMHVFDRTDALHILWVTLLGYKFSRPGTWPSQFPEMLRQYLLALQLQSTSDISRSLTQVAWSDRIWDAQMISLLESIEVY